MSWRSTLRQNASFAYPFTAVVHYDPSWNPARHEQREGRVNRFGQQPREVRTLMLYGADNPVDGAVLKVILRKAETIKKELGVLVPMPEDESRVTQTLMNAVLLHRRSGPAAQRKLDFGPEFDAVEHELDTAWQNASERIARNNSIFAQRRLKPDDVIADWRRTLAVLGGEEDVERFVRCAAQRLEAPLEPYRGGWRLPRGHLPAALQDRLAADGLSGTQVIRFRRQAGTGGRFLHRTHPLVSRLADHVLETALDPEAGESPAVRCAALFTTDVATVTVIWLLRVRNQITVTRRDRERTILAEEALTMVSEGDRLFRPTPEQSESLLAAEPAANMADGLRARHVRNALDRLNDWMPRFEGEAQTVAAALLEDHRRVRRASDAIGRYRVEPVLPVDIMAVYVLVPFRG